jgi:gluconokinase
LICLVVDREVLAQRLTARHGHFFHVQLLGSQLDTVEPPQPDEHTVTVVEHLADQPADTVARIIGLLSPDDGGGPGRLQQ